jgi:hypothetical protein
MEVIMKFVEFTTANVVSGGALPGSTLLISTGHIVSAAPGTHNTTVLTLANLSLTINVMQPYEEVKGMVS